MAEETQPRWEGKACVETAVLTAEQAWGCFQDFFNVHKWHPSLDTCYQVEATAPGEPAAGLVRYCAASTLTKTPSSTSDSDDQCSDDDDHDGLKKNKTIIRWLKEKLIMIDPIQRRLSYQITDNNVGIKSYVAKLEVFSLNGGDDDDGKTNGCRVELSYVVADPIEGWRFEDLAAHTDSNLRFMINKMEQYHSQPC